MWGHHPQPLPAVSELGELPAPREDLVKVGLWASEGQCTCLSGHPCLWEGAEQHQASRQALERGGLNPRPVFPQAQPQNVIDRVDRVSSRPHSLDCGFPFWIQKETQVLGALPEPRRRPSA